MLQPKGVCERLERLLKDVAPVILLASTTSRKGVFIEVCATDTADWILHVSSRGVGIRIAMSFRFCNNDEAHRVFLLADEMIRHLGEFTR